MKRFLERVRSGISTRLALRWSPHALPNRAKAPIVTFSFDDFPRSAANAGAHVLRDFGVKGTFFVSGSRTGRNLDGVDQFTAQDLIDVAESGHEIGCHTFSRLRVPCAGRGAVRDDIERNKDFVRRVLGEYTMSSFAYPYGHVTVSSKAILSRHFPICRGIWCGVNSRRIDFMNLKAVSLDPLTDYAQLLAMLDETQASNGWLIFFTHDISDDPSPYGYTPGDLARLVGAVLERGIEILPMKNAAGRARFS